MKKRFQLGLLSLSVWLMAAAGYVAAQGVQDSLGSGGGGRGGAIFGGNTSAFGNTSATAVPWFSNAGVREQLKLDDERHDILTNSYNQNRDRYRKELAEMDDNLPSEERERRSNEIYQRYYKEFNKSRDQVLNNADLLRRYDQLHRQYQVYGAFFDPQVQQRLNLTSAQRQILQRYHDEAIKDLGSMRNGYDTDPEETAKRFSEWRDAARDRVYSTLTAEQHRIWKETIGDPYDFHAADYLHRGKK